MKKAIIPVILIIITIVTIFLHKPQNQFKQEYESLNGKKDQSGKTYETVNINSEIEIDYIDYEKLFKLLKTTSVIYFCYPESSSCRSSVSPLMEALEETGIDKIYYLNNKEDRDEKTLKDGNIIVKKEGTNNYQKLLNKLGNSADTYEGLEKQSVKRLYYPTLIAVKSGKIVSLISKKENIKLTSSEKKQLKKDYIEAINKTLMCDTSSANNC